MLLVFYQNNKISIFQQRSYSEEQTTYGRLQVRKHTGNKNDIISETSPDKKIHIQPDIKYTSMIEKTIYKTVS